MHETAPLTWRQHKVLTFLRTYIAQAGYPPSIREVANGCGLSSTSAVSHQLEVLRARGYIQRDPKRPRAIVIREPGGVVFVARADALALLAAVDGGEPDMDAIGRLREAVGQ